MTSLARIAVVLILASLGGCDKKEPAAPPKTEPPKEVVKAPETKPEAKPEAKPEPKAEAAFQKPVLDGLTKAGLKVGEFEQTAARPYKARSCVQGEVGGLEVLLCSFEAEQPAKDAARSLEQFIGTATTGAVRQRGTVAIAVADRKKTDLKGQQINKLLQAFTAGT